MSKSGNGNQTAKERLAELVRMKEDTEHFEFVWEELDERGIIEDWERDATTDKDVQEDARELLRLYRKARTRRRPSPSEGEEGGQGSLLVPVDLEELERDATDALRKHTAVCATGEPRCKTLGRRPYLGASYSRETKR